MIRKKIGGGGGSGETVDASDFGSVQTNAIDASDAGGDLGGLDAGQITKPKLQFTTTSSKPCGLCTSFDGEVYEQDDPDLPDIPMHDGCECEFQEV